MKRNVFQFLMFVLATMFVFTACENDEPTVEPDNKTIQESMLTEKAVSDAVMLANSETGVKNRMLSACGDFVYDPVNNTLTITFPESGCTGEDGVTRSGVITAQFEGDWQTTGSSATISFDAYKRDGVGISGEIVLVFTTSGLIPELSVTATDMVLTFEDNTTINWTASTTYKYNGLNTPTDLSDDYFTVNGVAEGTTREGNSFTMVASDLQTAATCKWFVGGNMKLSITEGDKTDVYDLTFSKTCGTVNVSYNGIPFTVNLNE